MLVCKNKGREKLPLVLLDLFFVDHGKHISLNLHILHGANCNIKHQRVLKNVFQKIPFAETNRTAINFCLPLLNEKMMSERVIPPQESMSIPTEASYS